MCIRTHNIFATIKERVSNAIAAYTLW